MPSFKANGDPLEGTIAVPNYGSVNVFNTVAMKSPEFAYGVGNRLLDTGAPGTVVVSSPSKTTTTVALSWTAATDDAFFNSGIASYNVYKGGVLVTNVTSGTTYTVTGLTTGTAYTFTVKAVDAHGNLSVASNSLAVTTN